MSVQVQVNGQWVTVADVLPVGAIIEIGNVVQIYTGNPSVQLWLPCNGAPVSRTTYAALFAAIGTTFGSGDGSTTFNVPANEQLELRNVVNITTGQTFGAFVGDTDIFINNTTGASIDISAGAIQAGIRISVEEQSSTQNITIYTDAAHTQSAVLSKGMIHLEWDGTQWRLIGETVRVSSTYTSSSSFKTPFAAVYQMDIESGGGGGGGAYNPASTGGANGGAGQRGGFIRAFKNYPAGVALTITVGGGGAGAPNGTSDGSAGGTSSVNDGSNTYSVTGGAGGIHNGASGSGGDSVSCPLLYSTGIVDPNHPANGGAGGSCGAYGNTGGSAGQPGVVWISF